MSTTKEKIIQSGIEVLLKKGYNGSGLKEILDAANIPKGSFYHFFKNKEDFGKEALSYYSDAFKPVLEEFLINSSAAPIKRFDLFFSAMIEVFDKEKKCKGGCLVGNLAQELADVNAPLRTHLLDIMESWNNYFESCLNEAKKAGELNSKTNTRELAEFMLNSWEGALLKMKMTRTVKPLQTFKQQIMRILMAPD